MRYRQFILGAVIGLGCFPAVLAGERLVGGDSDDDASSHGGGWFAELLSGQHRFDASAEFLHSDDIEIEQYQFQYELKQPVWDVSLTLGYTIFDEEYVPGFAAPGELSSLREETERIQLRVGAQLGKRWSIDLTGAYYDGFAGYRSVWIAEYYRQLFGFLPDYEDPDPSGYSASLGLTFSYASGHSVRATVGYGRDTIAPGYSFGGAGLERSRENLYRISSTLLFEDVWTPWLKSLHRFSYVGLTDRDTRLGFSSTWHVALGDRLTLRVTAGYSEEGDDFEALYGGLTLEWEFADGWYVSVGVDLYSDTGEVPNAGFSTAAPGIDTLQYGVGLRWVSGEHAVRLYAALYENEYDPLSGDNRFFENLYQDRDWVLVQLAYTYQF